MFTSQRHLSKQFRLWLLAAAAILLLTSVIEASHLHGVFTEVDDHCSLCQHSVVLDKTLTSNQSTIIPLLQVVMVASICAIVIPSCSTRFALIRAPPALLHHG